ncbi:MAG: TRAP transporter small permease subunit [Pseudomonadota bacterium]
MRLLLRLSGFIDRLTERIGRATLWLVLVAVVISSGNAVSRKLFDMSSNGMLEIQWYLFAAVFLLGAGYTMLRQGHVKIDVISNRLSKRMQIIIELFGIAVFLFPFVVIVIRLVWPLVMNAVVSGEMSENAGGLIRWPVYALVPLGFMLLGAQGLSEFIKRVAYLRGAIDDPTKLAQNRPAELALAEEIRTKQVAGEVIDRVEEIVDMIEPKKPRGDVQ